MGINNKSSLIQAAEAIRTEKEVGKNSAQRVGQMFTDVINNADSTLTTVQTTANNAIPMSMRAKADGVAPLNAKGKLSVGYLQDNILQIYSDFDWQEEESEHYTRITKYTWDDEKTDGYLFTTRTLLNANDKRYNLYQLKYENGKIYRRSGSEEYGNDPKYWSWREERPFYLTGNSEDDPITGNLNLDYKNSLYIGNGRNYIWFNKDETIDIEAKSFSLLTGSEREQIFFVGEKEVEFGSQHSNMRITEYDVELNTKDMEISAHRIKVRDSDLVVEGGNWDIDNGATKVSSSEFKIYSSGGDLWQTSSFTFRTREELNFDCAKINITNGDINLNNKYLYFSSWASIVNSYSGLTMKNVDTGTPGEIQIWSSARGVTLTAGTDINLQSAGKTLYNGAELATINDLSGYVKGGENTNGINIITGKNISLDAVEGMQLNTHSVSGDIRIGNGNSKMFINSSLIELSGIRSVKDTAGGVFVYNGDNVESLVKQSFPDFKAQIGLVNTGNGNLFLSNDGKYKELPLENYITGEPNGINKIVKMTQAQYSGLSQKDANTMYVIID